MAEKNKMVDVKQRNGSTEAEVAYWSRLFGVAPDRAGLTRPTARPTLGKPGQSQGGDQLNRAVVRQTTQQQL